MRLAFLGLDEQTRAILRATGGGRHRAVLFCELPAADRNLAAEARGEMCDWELLLDDDRIDAVVVASAAAGEDEERRAEQLRKLVQAAVPLLVAHPVVDSLLLYYELDMIRRESGGIVAPYLPARWSPLVARLADFVARPQNSPIGPIEQAIFERAMAGRSRGDISIQFARDVDILRAIGGELSRVSAMGARDAEERFTNLGVQMSGAGPMGARWSIAPAGAAPGGRLTLAGSHGEAVLHLSDDGPWKLEIQTGDGGEPEMMQDAESEIAAAAIEALAEAIRSGGGVLPAARAADDPFFMPPPRDSRRPALPDLQAAIGDLELAEAIERSLARGRTIELQRQDVSEAGTFKGLMTALGCGMLMAIAGLLFCIALLQQIARANGWLRLAGALNAWPLILLAALGLFLLFQLLLRLAKPAETKPRE